MQIQDLKTAKALMINRCQQRLQGLSVRVSCVNESPVSIFVAVHGLFKALQFNLAPESADRRSDLKKPKKEKSIFSR